MQVIRIVSAPDEAHPYLVIDKPKGLPSAPLSSTDEENALAQALTLFPGLAAVKGKKAEEHGLLHRLDTQTNGLMLIAASQAFYDYMEAEQREGRFIKYYTALCDYFPNNAVCGGGFPPSSSILSSMPMSMPCRQLEPSAPIVIESFFRHYGEGRREVRPVTKESGAAAIKKIGKQKSYRTEITAITEPEPGLNAGCPVCRVECRIAQGFRHQVRCHLAWAGLPVCGDTLYNFSGKKNAEKLAFSASRIIFEYPRGELNSYILH